jgi:hypothetical protein
VAFNPLIMMKHRLSAAIDWRVRQEFAKERDLMTGISEAMTDISVSYTDQIAALEKLVENLNRRINELEKRPS